MGGKKIIYILNTSVGKQIMQKNPMFFIILALSVMSLKNYTAYFKFTIFSYKVVPIEAHIFGESSANTGRRKRKTR